jgi:cytochrome c553
MRKGAMLAAAIGVAVAQGAFAEDYRSAEIFNGLCNRCHGLEGLGVKGLEAPLIAGMPAWYVEGQLHKFRDGARGLNPKDMPGMRMRPMARTLDKSDIKGISAYVANLKAQPQVSGLEGGNAEQGKAKFTLCVGCHGPDAMGNEMMKAPPLASQSDWYLFAKLKNFKAGIRGSDAAKDPTGAMMRGMVGNLDEQSMLDIATYLGSLPKK